MDYFLNFFKKKGRTLRPADETWWFPVIKFTINDKNLSSKLFNVINCTFLNNNVNFVENL